VFATSDRDLRPDPNVNEIRALFFHVTNPKADMVAFHNKR